MSNQTLGIRSHTVEFLEKSSVFALVPRSSTRYHGTVEQTPQRQQLYLGMVNGQDFVAVHSLTHYRDADERVIVHIVLESHHDSITEVEQHLLNLQLTLETFCESDEHENQDENTHATPSKRELVDVRSVKDSGPLIEVKDSLGDEGGAKPILCITWKTEVHLSKVVVQICADKQLIEEGRSRVRHPNSSIQFVASVALRAPQTKETTGPKDEYLPSGVPESVNILAAFHSDPEFRDNTPVLSAARLSKILPASATIGETARPLRSQPYNAIPIAPVIGTSVGFSHVGAAPNLAKVLASLDIEVDPSLETDLLLDSVELSLSDGRVEPLGVPRSLALPKLCRPQDSMSFVYSLLPSNLQALSSTGTLWGPSHVLSLHVTGSVLNSDDKDAPGYPIKIHWRTQVDLSTLYRNLPSVLNSTQPPRNSASDATTQQAPPQALSSLLTITISGPSTVRVGATLKWSFLLANRSHTRTLRLALTPLLTVDGASSEVSSLVPLTPDLKIGPLPAGASATAEMRFLVLTAGVLRVHAVRVVDLDEEGAEGGGRSLALDKSVKVGQVDLTGALLPDIVAVDDEDSD